MIDSSGTGEIICSLLLSTLSKFCFKICLFVCFFYFFYFYCCLTILFRFGIVGAVRVVVQGPGPGPLYGHAMDLVAERYLVTVSGNDGEYMFTCCIVFFIFLSHMF